MEPLRRGLYAIADLDALDARGLDPLRFADAVLRARPVALQLRAKHAPHERAIALLRELAPACRAYGVPLVANDHVELAVVTRCDALHLGQDDVSPSLARSIAPTTRLGLSTHSPEQLSAALARFPWYVAYGPVFATSSKERPDPVVGLAGLAQAAELVRAFAREHGAEIPLVAIGGIDVARAAAAAEHATAVAVIAGLLPPIGARAPWSQIEDAAAAYVAAIEGEVPVDGRRAS
jgi:thiamine-phosphate pyrophosphorylase